ncbi:MAG: RNA-binding S4 domain-containing protein [Pseudomonadota bacterium]
MTRRGAAGPVRPNEVEAVANTSGGVGPGQRLDKWLWYTRIVKSRSLAAALIEAGRVRLNRTKVDKPKQTVRPGDVITATVNRKVRVLKVVLPGVRRGPAVEAQTLYEDLTPVEVPTTAQTRQDQPLQPLAVAQREPGSRRPTKRERRQTDQLRGRD